MSPDLGCIDADRSDKWLRFLAFSEIETIYIDLLVSYLFIAANSKLLLDSDVVPLPRWLKSKTRATIGGGVLHSERFV